jgi:hypothetical protein
MIDRRQVLAALAMLAGGSAAADPLPGIDAEGARQVGEAYLRQNPAARDAARLAAELLPKGWDGAGLKTRVAADFRAGRLFVHRGWRLSDTEGRLFALAALSPT